MFLIINDNCMKCEKYYGYISRNAKVECNVKIQ